MDKDLLYVLSQLYNQDSYRKFEENLIDQEFNKVKKSIIDDFNNNPITKEIEAGISALNISNTLSGITNLYSFIGFDAGTDPISPIRILLEKSSYRILRKKRNASASIIFEIPTAADIFLVTPMPWATGRSWAKGIESGISGLGYYLKVTKNSRSGLGIQTPTQKRTNVRFQNKPYISQLINKFNSELKKINNLIV